MGKKRRKKSRGHTSGEAPRLRSRNVEKLATKLFTNEEQREKFLAALTTDSSRRAVAWVHEPSSEMRQTFGDTVRAPWIPHFAQVPDSGERPGASGVHERGYIYCLDLSSVFAAAPLSVVPSSPSLVIDMCAAPGGKGILAWRSLSPKSIVFNEVIRKRTAQLISNVRRCRISGALVTSNDPKDVGVAYEGAADVVIVDAPCSGQSLLARDLAAPGAFHPATISANAQRQRRILAHSQRCVRPGGYLLYSTCTFSPEENEQTLEWFFARFPHFSSCQVPSLSDYRSPYGASMSYRLFPQSGLGAGSFCALMRYDGVAAPAAQQEEEERISPIRTVCSV